MLSRRNQDFSDARSVGRCGALVVGAGPAGLFASMALVASGVEDIVVIDSGPDVDVRRDAVSLSRELGIGHPEYERGVGGAGLFSDGKLCLSLDVGGHLERSLGDGRRSELLDQVSTVFRTVVTDEAWNFQSNGKHLEDRYVEAEAHGLRFKHYPVAHIGTDRCSDVISELRGILAHAGVSFRSETELVGLSIDEADKVAFLKNDDEMVELRAERIVLALGKVGAAQQADLCRNIGIETTSQRIYVGVRFETDADLMAPLFSSTKDPKYSARLVDGSRVKTHCASEGGEVIELRYDGLPLAGGHNYSYAKTSRSGFSILWDGLATGSTSSYAAATAIMSKAAAIGDGKLIAQRLVDYRARRNSTPADLAAIALTCGSASPADLREVLPPPFFEAMDSLLARLEGLIPGFVDDNAVAYAPAIEWWMDRVSVNENFNVPAIPGLAICGDGSGWSQGIVHAAATGLLAAEGLVGEAADVAKWAGRVSGRRLQTV
jgi:uncharacterized protein